LENGRDTKAGKLYRKRTYKHKIKKMENKSNTHGNLHRRTSAFYDSEWGLKWKHHPGVVSEMEEWRKDYRKWTNRTAKNIKRHKPRGDWRGCPTPDERAERLAEDPDYYTAEKLYERQKIRQIQKTTCECGKIVSRGNLLTHQKSKHHQTLMKRKEENRELKCECGKPFGTESSLIKHQRKCDYIEGEVIVYKPPQKIKKIKKIMKTD
jgi:hypothetical protein